jgi:hypothetical protein
MGNAFTWGRLPSQTRLRQELRRCRCAAPCPQVLSIIPQRREPDVALCNRSTVQAREVVVPRLEPGPILNFRPRYALVCAVLLATMRHRMVPVGSRTVLVIATAPPGPGRSFKALPRAVVLPRSLPQAQRPRINHQTPARVGLLQVSDPADLLGPALDSAPDNMNFARQLHNPAASRLWPSRRRSAERIPLSIR